LDNVSDAGVKALAEAGCGFRLQKLILGAVWQCPFRSYCGAMHCGLTQSHVAPWRCSLCLFYFVAALPPDVLVAMNGEVAGVVCCDMMWR